ncbi:FecR family protein [Chitinophaga vietnamensis]|uniref:FecR family protein n=1 Tax=Chitinophaga vietnamensis TaxID=2593957 RepID=UPI00117879B6|nr:FecR family protein [Chitinophaga vietnamensis]
MEERLRYLLQQHRENALTEEETAELETFFLDEDNRDLFNQVAPLLWTDTPDSRATTDARWEPVLDHILQADKPAHGRQVSYHWWRYAAAAVLLGVVATLVFYPWRQHPAAPQQLAAQVAPGGNKAVLQLANGRSIVLSDEANGVLAQQGGTQLVKKDSGFLAYEPGQQNTNDAGSINTLSTPRGGQFRVKLPDGTLVWLNAASSLKYPAAFTGADRTVELQGEAYFEVAANAHQPFHVKSKGQDVMVLGTHFNINAYADEPVTATTLLSGKVKVSGKNFESVLQPGQQAQCNASGQWQLLNHADLNSATAWKNGYFSFNHADIVTVMRQLARWYDINVQIETKNTQQAFVGEIPRNVSLEKALEILKSTDIHYLITGNTIRIIN